MNRISVYNFMFGLKNYQWQQHPLLANHVEMGIEMIFDDFESRTCENCKHCENVGLVLDPILKCYNEKSVLEDFVVSKDFGCNKFERKA